MNWEALAGSLKEKLLLDEPLSKHTSFKIGGPADAFARPSSVAELKASLDFARQQRQPVFFLAGGTNLLVRDSGVRGLVIKLEGEFKDIAIQGTGIRVGAGANLALLSKKASLASLSGLEFAIGIPGTLGGGLVMNAGAHGQELSEVTRRIGYLENGEIRELGPEQAGFGYRNSRFKNSGLLLLWAELELKAGDPFEIERRMEEVLSKRKASQPQSVPNAGCVFKNPSGDSAGRLIEQCGLKGARCGGAAISDVHANFVVNLGHAKASDVLDLMEKAREAVKARFQVNLEDEVLIVGEA
jgi:UDP-N-acetylmuramate dehydrogenase